MEGRLLRDVVVRKSAAVLELLAGEVETLLIGGDALLVLDHGLDVVNGVRGIDVEGDGLVSPDEDLHTATASGSLVAEEKAGATKKSDDKDDADKGQGNGDDGQVGRKGKGRHGSGSSAWRVGRCHR